MERRGDQQVNDLPSNASQRIDRNGSRSELRSSAPIFQIEDLTALVANAGASTKSPFSTDEGYRQFFNQICRALHRQTPRHALVVCEKGVGERAAIAELALMGVRGSPPFLSGRRVFLVDCRKVPSQSLWSFVETWPEQLGPDVILCLDGFGAVLRACSGWERRSALIAILSAIQGRIVGLIAPHEYEEQIAGSADLREMFEPVTLAEPTATAAIPLVHHFCAGLGSMHEVAIAPEAIDLAIKLTDTYVLNHRLPSKAVQIIRSICDDLLFDRTQLSTSDLRSGTVTESSVLTKVAQVTGIPETTLAGTGEGVDYRAALADLVVGQEHAVQEVATELGLIKAGMVDAGKPASVMLFIGQTGTGKTELAKALARLYSSSKRLKVFTLGNFSEPHSVSGIIGVPPGYVGHDQGGRLVNELAADPYGVFLLDEADKAHPDVMQPFLNLFDEGWVSDQRGIRAHAGRAIFILTTNVGQRQISDMCRAGKSTEEITSTMKETLSRIRHSKSNRPVFTAEFLARVKRVVVFRTLAVEAMIGIAQIQAARMKDDWLQKRSRSLAIPDALAESIGRRAYELDQKAQGREGGRIVRKLMADLIEAPIQNLIGQRPHDYQSCRHLTVRFSPPGDSAGLSAGCVEVIFGTDGPVSPAQT